MKRLKSIDIYRGLAMVYVMVGHLIDWWSVESWVFLNYVSLFSALGAFGFTFISGLSTMISYRNRLTKMEKGEFISYKQIKYEYLFRGLFITILGLIYNIIVAIMLMDPFLIWTWYIILTVGVSLLMAWPLLKTSKIFRILIGVIFWIVGQILFILLSPFEGQFNLFGVLFYILYNTIEQNVILSFFTIFIVGTVVGDIIYDIYLINNELEKKKEVKKKILYPLLLTGIILIIIGFNFLSPDLFTEKILSIQVNIWWLIYSLGIDLILISILLAIDVYNLFNSEKSYRFFFYFSYYSLTIFLIQNINYFFFNQSLHWYDLFLFIPVTMLIYGFLLRLCYKKWGPKFSIKVQIGRLASGITKRIIK